MTSLSHAMYDKPKRHFIQAIISGIFIIGGFASFAVIGQASPPPFKAVNIASVPLYAATQGDKPTLALALSVEFPTVGAQYVSTPGGTEDSSYTPANEYIGYYNAEKCYTYVDNPSESAVAPKTVSDYKRFVISGTATAHQCTNAFSGNFLNWASSSAIDMLRLALSGGDRYIDETNLTILQRAVIPNGDPTCMWNSSNFPAKKLNSSYYAGAVPNAMVSAANSAGASAIWVANTLNRIYFGTAKGGSCGNPGSYSLSTTKAMGSIITKTGSLPSDATICAAENGSCTASGIQEVWYGGYTSGSPSSGKWKVAPVSGGFNCTNGVFTDPASGTAKNCYLRSYTGSWTPPGGPGLNSDGFFYARAEVCNKSGSTLVDDRDYNFCNKYPNGNFKPNGVIQKYNNQLRLAAFGYALEQTLSWDNGASKAGRYGGVLRAPMKYVGPRTYDINGTEDTPAGGNPNAEWNALTGIFNKNPDGDTTFGISGVINYLNQFGRTGPVPGRYKKYDPSGELYYETLRYMQGLPPSSAAVDNLDLGNTTQVTYYDGYPIYKDWSAIDPFGNGRDKTADYSCLKSNIALIGDINTWDSRYTSGGSHNRMAGTNIANNIPDIEKWISVVRAFEKKQVTNYIDGQGASRTTSNPNSASSGPTSRGEQVYGLSYWAHTHDIRGADWTAEPDKQRPGLRVKSFFFDVNEYATESVDSQRRNNNQYYTAGKYGGFLTQPTQDARPYNTTGNPFYDKDGNPNNDVWQDPAKPLEPQTYFLQSDARGVLAAFERIFSEASSAQRSIAGAASSSSKVTTGSLVYQASFDTSSWWGDVQAFPLSIDAVTKAISMGATAMWSADQQLSNRLVAGSPDRNIVVGVGGVNPSPRATDFKAASIVSALQDDLDRPAPGAASDGLWKDRLDYIRGDKSKEGSPFRVRFHALGDVVNSGLQFIGAPSPRSNLGKGYTDFANKAAVKNRTNAIYVGANDGMMHAFNADNGEELFAYIPSWLGPKLSLLTDKDYLHQAYVDASPVIGDIQYGSDGTADDWKTILISGSGGGGRGVFALDVTDPAAFDASKVMWEFTQANDSDMGYVLGKPRIIKLRTSAPSATPVVTRWFAMVPAGVNNYVDSGDGIFSPTGAPTIFLLALDKPIGTAWSLGNNYYKISFPFDSTLATSKAVGIVNLEAYMNETGLTEFAAAGDLHGNVWALDFTGFGASDWSAGNLSRFNTGSAGSLTAYPMYIAKDAGGSIQPITAAPTIIGFGRSNKHLIGFGTGKYIEPGDSTSTQQNTYYTIYDNGSGSASGGTSGVVGIQGRGRLKVSTLDAVTGKFSPNSAFTWGRPASDGDATKRSGWYYDLPGNGERIVYDSVAVPMTTKAAFSSLMPDSASTPGVCSISGGTGSNYFVDLFYGTGTSTASLVGLSGQPMLVIGDISENFGASGSPSGRTTTEISTTVIQQGSGGLSIPPDGTQKIQFPSGRLSWRQINNYLELHNK